MIRGLVRTRTRNLGNFWVDLVRTTVRILIPLSFVIGVVLKLLKPEWNISPLETAIVGATALVSAAKAVASSVLRSGVTCSANARPGSAGGAQARSADGCQ